MAAAEQIKALIKSHSEGDEARFYSVAMQIAANEAKRGHGKLAQDLRITIDTAKSSTGNRSAIPINRRKGEVSDLLTSIYPKFYLKDMVLDKQIKSSLERILKEQRHTEVIRSHNLEPRRKILLTGPPGCGKTMSAHAIAGELGLPLNVIRLDGLITKYMGESIAKLHLIFETMVNFKGVYFFDEFDSIGSHRNIVNDVGEIKRVLNGFLSYIEQDNSNSLIIAATNLPQTLDNALFRRFDDIVEYKLPDLPQILEVIKRKLAGIKTDRSISYEALAQKALRLSYSEITRACNEAIKEMIINKKDILCKSDLVSFITERKAFHDSIK